jgi:hypothetical protein
VKATIDTERIQPDEAYNSIPLNYRLLSQLLHSLTTELTLLGVDVYAVANEERNAEKERKVIKLFN